MKNSKDPLELLQKIHEIARQKFDSAKDSLGDDYLRGLADATTDILALLEFCKLSHVRCEPGRRLPCPSCKTDLRLAYSVTQCAAQQPECWEVTCLACSHAGPPANTQGAAIARWNRSMEDGF